MKGGDSLNHRAKTFVDKPFMKTLKTVDPKYEKDILKHSESMPLTGVEDPSSGRSSNKPKSPQPIHNSDVLRKACLQTEFDLDMIQMEVEGEENMPTGQFR